MLDRRAPWRPQETVFSSLKPSREYSKGLPAGPEAAPASDSSHKIRGPRDSVASRGPQEKNSRYGFSGFSDFEFGLPSAECFSSPADPACVTSSIRVPLSRCTFFPAEVITVPCVAFDAAAFKFRPFNPKTPWLFEVSCPAAFNPPTAPFEAPATFPAAFAVEFTAPPAAPPTLAAAFVTVPAAPPAAEVTPPSPPRPPAIPEPAAEPLSPPIVSTSEPAAEALLCDDASA